MRRPVRWRPGLRGLACGPFPCSRCVLLNEVHRLANMLRLRPTTITLFATIFALFVAVTGCRSQNTPPDSTIETQVRSALSAASDVPGSQLEVEVANGIVTLTGSVACSDCGGQTTPGGTGTVEQSIGAIIRAVPGVQSVRFMTEPEPEEPAPGE
jgi:hypothetical protein